MTGAKRAVLNVRIETLSEIRKLGGHIQAETGENMTDDKTIQFLLRAREELVDLVTEQLAEHLTAETESSK